MIIIHQDAPPRTMPPQSACLDALLHYRYDVSIISPISSVTGMHQIIADGFRDGRPHHIQFEHADLHQALCFAARQLGDDRLGRYLATLTPPPAETADPRAADVRELLTLIKDVLDLPEPEFGHWDAHQRLLVVRASAVAGFARGALAFGDSNLIPVGEHARRARLGIVAKFPVTYPTIDGQVCRG